MTCQRINRFASHIFWVTPVFNVYLGYLEARNDNTKIILFSGACALTLVVFILLTTARLILFSIPWKLSPIKRKIYYGVIASGCIYFYLCRVRTSARKLDLNLDNAFVADPDILSRFPSYPTVYKQSENDAQTCSLMKQTVSWHWALDDLFRPFHWLDTDCADSKYYQTHDFSQYFEVIANSGKNTTKVEF